MAELAICARCGAEKDLPLGRCAGCGHVPTGEDRLVALVCSVRVSEESVLRQAQARIRRGEPLRPTAALVERARGVLSGVRQDQTRLERRQLAWIILANLLLTPLVGYAIWYRFRADRGPAGRQALLVTVPCSVALAAALLAWHVARVG